MKDLNVIFKIIDSYTVGPDFLGPVHPDKVREAEMAVGVKFPRSYKRFLERYGCGNFGGEIYGITPSNSGVPSAIWVTLEERKKGYIPDWMVIIGDEDEYVFCLDTSVFDGNDECKVISWVLGLLPHNRQPREIAFDSFADFLYERVQWAIQEGWWRPDRPSATKPENR